MESIRTKLIHLLGGLTIEESKESDVNCIGIGKWFAFKEVERQCRDLNGQPAEVWCDELWKWLVKRIENLKKGGE